MPQTIGPFSQIQVFAKQTLLDLCQPDIREMRGRWIIGNLMIEFDPNKCQQGVDMAFLLPTIDPPTDWVRNKKHNRVVSMSAV